MKYCAIDIETTGLDPDNCQIIQFAAVFDDLNVQAPLETLPKYETYVIADTYKGEAYALAMNAGIFEKIANYNGNNIKADHTGNLLPQFSQWLRKECKVPFLRYPGTCLYDSCVRVVAAGKNFANFDNQFLRKLPGYDRVVKFHHRVLDPASLYFDPRLDKDCLPSTEKCMKRAGIEGEVAHTALEDALTVVKLLRKKFPIGA